MPNLPQNSGRLINYVNGIQGVAASGQALVNLPVGCRVHRASFQCTAINYTGPTIALVGAGTYNATLTPTVANGVITAVAITAAGSGMTNGTYTSAGGGVAITDATGVGAQLSITVSGGAVTAVAIVSGGTPGPIAPNAMISTVKQVVGGTNIRDITADQILRIAAVNGVVPDFGELPIYYTEPWRNFIKSNALTSWDLAGQTDFHMQFQINNGISTPGISGVIEFDYTRNGRTNKTTGAFTPILQPVAQHAFSQNLAIGKNSIVTIPITAPIGRMWILGATPGNIYQIEILADGTKVLEATFQQMAQMYRTYGFQVGDTYQAQNANGNNGWGSGSPGNGGIISSTNVSVPTAVPAGPLSKAPWLAGNGVFPFDFAYIADLDGRPWRALRVATSLVVNIWSSAAQACNVIVESYPGKFSN